MQDGLGDTIRVSLTESPMEEIDPCRRLANLGMRAANLQQGVVRITIMSWNSLIKQPKIKPLRGVNYCIIIW